LANSVENSPKERNTLPGESGQASFNCSGIKTIATVVSAFVFYAGFIYANNTSLFRELQKVSQANERMLQTIKKNSKCLVPRCL
jgi:hypothetical protein